MAIYCITGLGNPGKKYEGTRHNLGFEVVNELAKALNYPEPDVLNFKKEKKLQCQYLKIDYQKEKLILVKPETFMNFSGQAVKKVLNFFDIKLENFLLIHDDIDLSLDKEQARLSYDSSSAGHKGVESVIQELGTQQFYRLRLGIRNEKFLAGNKIPTEKFVLGKFLPVERKNKNNIIQSALKVIFNFLEDKNK